MTNNEAAEEIQKAIDLIKQDGKDWLDERDIPILEMAINALTAQPETHDKHSETHACDCIERQAAIDAVNTALFPKINTAKDAEKALRNLPSAQPEIIMCKNCKHHGTNGYRLNCAVFCCTMPDDGFCSCGERRTDG